MDPKKDNQNSHSRTAVTTTGNNGFPVSVAKRSERLGTALYLVTNFLSDNEPIKFRLRGLALDLLKYASNVRYKTIVSDRDVLEEMQGFINETLSLLEIAFISGIVSEMNFTILKREYASLRDSIEVKKVSRESRSDGVLGSGFFAQSHTTEDQTQKTFSPRPFPPQVSETKEISKGHYKGQNNIKMSDRMSFTKDTKIRTPLGQAIKDTIEAPVKRDVGSDVAKEARRARIIKLIKDNVEVTIKDITNHFPDLSEKTIQRELVSLTSSGVLKKKGERRWSRYSLA